MINFQLTSEEKFSSLFRKHGVTDFESACQYIARLPYGRNSNREDFALVLDEQKGTCSSKHALLARVAEENAIQDIELIVGIFLMSTETHPQLAPFFSDKPYTSIPECHCYLRFKGQRYDFTVLGDTLNQIAPKIVREQRAEPQQVAYWKPAIHKDYLQRWLNRNPAFNLTLDEIWEHRETCISLL